MYEQSNLTKNRSARTRTGLCHRQRGASLIEVMVVLVILLVGIFLVIRIFPTGFGVLQANGNRSLAVRLADQLMSGVDGDAANLPDGVLFAYQVPSGAGATIKFATDVDPDKLGTYNPTAAVGLRENSPAYNPYFSDINRFRFIKGEGVKVPLPTVAGDPQDTNNPTRFQAGSVYTCKYGPLYMDSTVGDPNNAPSADPAVQERFNSYLRVYGAPLTGISRDQDQLDAANAYGYFRTPQVYLMDYGEDDGESGIMFAPRAPTTPPRPNPNRVFAITFTSEDKTTGQISTSTTTITVPDSAVPVWQKIVLGGNNVGGIVTGSESVSRAFDRLRINDTWDSADPYQYKLASNNVVTGGVDANTGVEDSQANVGVLLFNPAGANYSELTANGNRAFTAYLDYLTLDWHIIREEREVPSTIGRSITAASGAVDLVPVRTTLSFLKRAGDAESDGTLYAGIYGAGDQDIDVFDLSNPTGKALVQGDYQGFISSGAQSDSDYFVDRDERGGTYRTGTIYLNRNRLIAGTKLRIFYKAQGDWGVSFQKAFSRYNTIPDPTDANGFARYPLQTNYETVGFNQFEPTTAQIRVPLQDFNKAFVVTIQYRTKDGQIKRLAPIQVTASQIDTQNVNITRYDTQFAYVDLPQYLPYFDRQKFLDSARSDAVERWQPIEVKGVSVKTRVVYRDNDSATNPYKVQDIDSYVTRRGQ